MNAKSRLSQTLTNFKNIYFNIIEKRILDQVKNLGSFITIATGYHIVDRVLSNKDNQESDKKMDYLMNKTTDNNERLVKLEENSKSANENYSKMEDSLKKWFDSNSNS